MARSAMSPYSTGKASSATTAHSDTNLIHQFPTRYVVSIMIVISMGLAVQICASLLASSSTALSYLGTVFILFLSGFCYEWTFVHSSALTRAKRAYFDETNVLETYQPRARTMGHLFCPEPPTPAPTVKFSESDDPEKHTAAENAEFNAARDQHYANMFAYAMKMQKEREAMEKQGHEGTTSDGTHSSVGSSVKTPSTPSPSTAITKSPGLGSK